MHWFEKPPDPEAKRQAQLRLERGRHRSGSRLREWVRRLRDRVDRAKPSR